MTRAVRIAGALICVSLVAAASAVAAPRLHRTTLPPPPPLPTSLAVDETEWKVVPSKTVVAAGPVTLRVYNRGMDDHDLSLVDAAGALHQVYPAAGRHGDRPRHPRAGPLPHLLLAVRRQPGLPRGARHGVADPRAPGPGAPGGRRPPRRGVSA